MPRLPRCPLALLTKESTKEGKQTSKPPDQRNSPSSSPSLFLFLLLFLYFFLFLFSVFLIPLILYFVFFFNSSHFLFCPLNPLLFMLWRFIAVLVRSTHLYYIVLVPSPCRECSRPCPITGLPTCLQLAPLSTSKEGPCSLSAAPMLLSLSLSLPLLARSLS